MEAIRNVFRVLFGLLFHNLITKLLCLLMAFLLYVYVNTSENIDRDFVIPLSIANRPPHMLVTSQSVADVRVVVNGPRAKMDQLQADDFSITLSLREAERPGEMGFRLYTDQVATPPGIRVRSIEPAQVTMRLEAIVASTVKIRPVLDGTPREGYELAEVKVTPDQVEVVGPPSVLDRLDALETEAVDIAGMTGSFVQRVGFRIPSLVSLSVQHSAIVAVTIREKTLERTLEGVPIRALSGRADVTIEPASASVQLSGPFSLIQSMTPAVIDLVVDDAALGPGEKAKRPVVPKSVPAQRIEVRVEPAEATISVLGPTPTPAEPTPSPRRSRSPRSTPVRTP